MRVVWLLPVIFLVPFATACDSVTDGQVITSIVSLCNQTYRLSKGLVVAGSEAVLDCNGATLEGPGTVGIVITGEKSVVQYCVIEGYDVGIFTDTRTEIRHVSILGSNVGIDASSGSPRTKDVLFEDVKVSVAKTQGEVKAAFAAPEPALAVPEAVPEKVREVPRVTGSAEVSAGLEESVFASINVIKTFVVGIVGLGLVSFLFFEVRRVGRRVFQKK